MKATLKWLPGIVAALLWVTLTSLIQPWLSQAGILLYVDAALLLVPARLLPLRPAVFAVLLGALFADALRAGPFGLSASLLLPALLVLHPFQRKLLRWPDSAWLGFIIGINTLAWIIQAAVWTLSAPTMPHPDRLLLGTLTGALVSSSFILLFGFWFIALQTSLFALAGNSLQTESPLASQRP